MWGGILVLIGFFVTAWQAIRTENREREKRGEPHTFRDDVLLLLSGLIVVGIIGVFAAYPPLQVIFFKSELLGVLFLAAVAGTLTYLFNRKKRLRPKRHRQHLDP